MRNQTLELECHSPSPSVSSIHSSASGGTSTSTSIPIQPRQRGQRGFNSEVLITSSIHLRQNTCAQCVMTGVHRESRHTGHSSSAPELNRVINVDTSFFRSSSGVEQSIWRKNILTWVRNLDGLWIWFFLNQAAFYTVTQIRTKTTILDAINQVRNAVLYPIARQREKNVFI